MNDTKQAGLVEIAIRRIEERYAIGQEILKACGLTSPHGVIAQLAEQFKINRGSAQTLQAMANPEIGYTGQWLKKWFKAFRDKGHALPIKHFVQIASGTKGPSRDELMREALDAQWSAPSTTERDPGSSETQQGGGTEAHGHLRG